MDKHKKANLKYSRFMRNGNYNDFKDILLFEKWYVFNCVYKFSEYEQRLY